MNSIRNRFAVLLASLVVFLFCLSGCQTPEETVPPTTAATVPAEPETTVPTETDPYAHITSLTILVTEEDILQLEDYHNLETLDLTSSTCYGAILDYIAAHPEVDVTYRVSLGNISVSSKETALTLNPGDFDPDLLLENLAFLPQITTVSLPDTTLTPEQASSLRERYSEITFDYTVTLFGELLDLTVTTLDLSHMTSDDVAEAAAKLGLLTALTDVELMNSKGKSDLTMEDVARLQDAAPGVTFHYSFTLFGKTLSTTTETVEYIKKKIGNEGEAQLRQALEIMDGCSYFKLDTCGIDSEILAAIREDYRNIKIVWRVFYGKNDRYDDLTDTELIRAVYNLYDDCVSELRYCEDVKYMDIGHNGTLTDLSFVGYMPQLEILIASGCAAKSLPGFENCKKLTWLEMAYCSYLEDISSLNGCESLAYLNLSFSQVRDLMPLDSLPLQRFVYLSPRASSAEREIFEELHENCLTRFTGNQPYGYGWRYDDNGKTYNEYYKKVREVFNYDYLDQFLPKDE